ncbi:MAG: hypothetical protein R2715_22360 [Ilumatobacteraceae bacterium]
MDSALIDRILPAIEVEGHRHTSEDITLRPTTSSPRPGRRRLTSGSGGEARAWAAVGIAIGTVFGVMFVFVNSGDPLPTGDTAAVRCRCGGSGHHLARSTAERGGGSPSPRRLGALHRELTANAGREAMLGTGYRWVVVVEFVVLFVGFQVMRLLDAPPEAEWRGWRSSSASTSSPRSGLAERSVLAPGVALSGLGALGLGLATTSSAEWVPFVSGVLSGAVLLLTSLTITSLRRVERAGGTTGSEWSETSSAR